MKPVLSRLRHLNLKKKGALFIAAILVVVITLSTSVLTLSFIPRLRNSLLMTSTLIGQNLAKDIKNSVDMGIDIKELYGVEDKLNQMVAQYPNLGYVYIEGGERQIIYRSKLLAAAPPELTSEGKATGDEQVVNSRATVSGESFYDTSLPIKSGGTTAGFIHLGMKSSVITAQVNAMLRLSLIIAVLSFLMSTLIITLFVNRFISSPLESLATTARRISNGELGRLEASPRGDEIGQLHEAFRVMVDVISAFVHHSRVTSKSLESSAGELGAVSKNLNESFSRQTTKLNEVLSSVAQMNQMTQSLTDQSKGLSSVASDSSSTIAESMAAIGEINHHMSEITTSVDNISSAIMEMSSTVREVAAGAENTAGMAEETRKAISLINNGILHIGSLAEQSKSLAGSLKRNAGEIGAQSMRETLKGIHSIQEEVRSAEAAMGVLQERVENIGDIVNVIDDIADQTNLLALNASIISAQAGEQGLAFAVVATEIRELAERTSESTKKIAGLIKGVQEESEHYSASLTRVISSVVKGINLGQETEMVLEKIIASADESSQMAAVIAQVTQEQTEASGKVSRSVDVFTQSAEEIRTATREEAKGAELIKDSMEKTKQMVDMVYRATDEQSRGSQTIFKTAEKAKEVSNELSAAMETHRSLSQGITVTVESLKNASVEISKIVGGINESAHLLNELSTSLKKELSRFRQTGETAPPPMTERRTSS